GIDNVTHFSRPAPVIMFSIIDAMNAVYSGSCDTVLVCSSMMRLPGMSRSAGNDPFRRALTRGGGPGAARGGWPENVALAAAPPGGASRSLHEYASPGEPFGQRPINCRPNAARNPPAAMRAPITMADYLDSRMIREPLCMLDMDVPVDGADAYVL